MSVKVASLGCVVAALLVSAGGVAHAETASSAITAGLRPNDFASTSGGPFTVAPHKTFQFVTKNGRWSVKVDVEQPLNRQTELKDTKVGAYFHVNPSLKIGGSVGLGDKFAQPQQLTTEDSAPRVHLETAFQF